jgi:crotonobetainyl-CoA:carnitine CoA-transferase CaiB-like acyl-CoA transferase
MTEPFAPVIPIATKLPRKRNKPPARPPVAPSDLVTGLAQARAVVDGLRKSHRSQLGKQGASVLGNVSRALELLAETYPRRTP